MSPSTHEPPRYRCSSPVTTVPSVIVEDDGCGFDVNAILAERKQGAGLGLVGMMERSQLLGGTFRVESTLRGGTRIEAHLPLDNSHR